MQVLVRDNNVDQALRVLKKKMQREGIIRELKARRAYEKPSEKRVREKAEAIRRARKAARKQAQREGLLPPPKPRVPVAGRKPAPTRFSRSGTGFGTKTCADRLNAQSESERARPLCRDFEVRDFGIALDRFPVRDCDKQRVISGHQFHEAMTGPIDCPMELMKHENVEFLAQCAQAAAGQAIETCRPGCRDGETRNRAARCREPALRTPTGAQDAAASLWKTTGCFERKRFVPSSRAGLPRKTLYLMRS